MTDGTRRFATQVKRDDDGLRRLAGWVEAVSDALMLPAGDRFVLALCVEEAAANLVMHAVPTGAPDMIDVVVDIVAEGLRLTIEDTCVPFDPRAAIVAGPLADLKGTRVGGLGIHLLRQYARRIDYATKAGVNRLTIIAGRAA